MKPSLFGALISQSRTGGDSFYLFDGLGSTAQMSDQAGSISDSYVYSSSGNTLQTTGSTANTFLFVGRQGYYFDVDETTYYVRSRVYAPGIGRWLSRPVAYGSPNAYLYSIRDMIQFYPTFRSGHAERQRPDRVAIVPQLAEVQSFAQTAATDSPAFQANARRVIGWPLLARRPESAAAFWPSGRGV